jgi:uncharacterized protein YndB with AHSA1/START domain
VQNFPHLVPLSSIPGKEDFAFQGTFLTARPDRLLQSEWLNDI